MTAEKDGDIAYAGSDWNEGIPPWDFGTGVNLHEAAPLLRGTVFTDRGVYRLGEEVHFKAILRHNTPGGIRLLPAGTPVLISVSDSQYRVVDERTVKLNAWSSAEWTHHAAAAMERSATTRCARCSRATVRSRRRRKSATPAPTPARRKTTTCRTKRQ